MSLVAFYGKKADHPLWNIMEEIQGIIFSVIHDNFIPYNRHQIHATIIGLETLESGGQTINRNYKKVRQQAKKPDLPSLLNYLKSTELFPLTIKTGGYRKEVDYSFTSQGKHPFDRTFSIHKDAIILMGWPYKENLYVSALDDFRHHCTRFGILHKYHDRPGAVDNDAYFVLGRLGKPLDPLTREHLLSRVMRRIETWKGTELTLSRENIHLIRYNELTLEDAEIVFPEGL